MPYSTPKKKKTLIKDLFPSYYNEVDAELLDQQYQECIRSFRERYLHKTDFTWYVVDEKTYSRDIDKVLKGDEDVNV